MIDRIVFAKRNLAVSSIHARTRCIHEFRDVEMTAGLQYVEESAEVGRLVDLGMLDRITHAGLCGEVADDIEFPVPKTVLQAFMIAKIRFQAGITMEVFETPMPIAFQSDPIVGVKVVQSGHGMAPGQQPFTEMHANETGRAGYQNIHFKKNYAKKTN
jgi:hypothetical protein